MSEDNTTLVVQDLTTRIDALRARLDALRVEHESLDAERDALIRERYRVLFGVQVGTLVEKGGKVYRVSSVGVFGSIGSGPASEKPWIYAFPKKAKGFSDRAVALYRDWEVIPEEAPGV